MQQISKTVCKHTCIPEAAYENLILAHFPCIQWGIDQSEKDFRFKISELLRNSKEASKINICIWQWKAFEKAEKPSAQTQKVLIKKT